MYANVTRLSIASGQSDPFEGRHLRNAYREITKEKEKKERKQLCWREGFSEGYILQTVKGREIEANGKKKLISQTNIQDAYHINSIIYGGSLKSFTKKVC